MNTKTRLLSMVLVVIYTLVVLAISIASILSPTIKDESATCAVETKVELTKGDIS